MRRDLKVWTESSRSELLWCHELLKKAAAFVAEGSFGHISLLPFVSASGKVSPASLCVPGTVYSESWEKAWTDASIRATPKGSMSAELFCEYVIRWEKWVRSTLAGPRPEPLLLLLDSGGGLSYILAPPSRSCVITPPSGHIMFTLYDQCSLPEEVGRFLCLFSWPEPASGHRLCTRGVGQWLLREEHRQWLCKSAVCFQNAIERYCRELHQHTEKRMQRMKAWQRCSSKR